MVSRAWEEGRQGASANGAGVSFSGEENVLELHRAEGCTTV